MKVFIDMAKRYGAKLVTSKGKHLKFRDKLGHQISAPKTSSDFRAIRNFQSELRNKGFVDSQVRTKKVATPKPAGQPKASAPTAKQRFEAGEKVKTGTQTTFKDFMQKVDTARTKAPVTNTTKVQGPESELANRMGKAYDGLVNKKGEEVLSNLQRRNRLVNRFGKVNEGAAATVASMAVRAGSNLVPKIMTGVGAVGTMLQASKADKERRRQLAKDNNLDITKPGDRAKLGRLLKKDTEAKKRAEKGDTRSQEQYRQEKAENRKTIDATRQQMGQSKAKPGTKERAEIDKNLKDFRDELRDVTNDPIVPSRARVRVKVGQEVPKPTGNQPPRTGASPQRVRDRRSYEAQQRRNRKQDIPEGMLPVPSMARRLMNNPPIPQQQDKEDKFKKQFDKKFKGYDKKIRDLKKELKASNKHRDEKLNYQYKDVTNPKRPSDPVKDLKKKGTA